MSKTNNVVVHNKHVREVLEEFKEFCGPQIVQSTYLVGGFVRDLLLGRYSSDVDFLVFGDTQEIARKFADHIQASFITLDEEHHVYRIVSKKYNIQIDMVGPKGNLLKEDLLKRDFTVNAMALPISDFLQFLCSNNTNKTINLNRMVIDYGDGLQHLQEKILVPAYPHTFIDDPLRILRGVRLAAQLGFTIPETIKHSMREAISLIREVSAERIRDELWGVFRINPSSQYIRVLVDEIQILQEIFDNKTGNEIDLEKYQQVERSVHLILEEIVEEEAPAHTYFYQIVAGGNARGPLLKLAALFGTSAPAVGKLLKLSAREISILNSWNRGIERIKSLPQSDFDNQKLVQILFHDLELETLGTLILYHTGQAYCGDNQSMELEQLQKGIITYELFARRLANLRPFISGNEIIQELSIQGKDIGTCLKLLRAAQIDGVVQNREQALEFVRSYSSNFS
ncbi:hypothetical protein BHU72_14905 [Desulfuribacillus stibiiarsenatis]|uniref:Poly A polymerase head domain-containing protein n=1 Tax=Desulfuribacillus stibiiarsenatis TaxID=1390249 RepID=A0A1E5L760_9FIRM|nr:CCA tRNA nucleotidyltransferase [Desulfuribacillus stibiiarsenatis]OEH85992.1 hypothetical protein BHU72_14905 [Desulfuribacillus stibiiarsenatis]